MVVSGNVDTLDVDASGAAVLHAPHLVVRTADVDLSGASRADLCVNAGLSLSLSGASDAINHCDATVAGLRLVTPEAEE